MAAPIVYRWDDGNAPVARGERRSLCDILHACLVTGYGSKPGAGWTREFVNATFDKAAFRNNPATGTGFFLQVDGAGAANAYTPKVQAFEVMTSESDGLNPFYATVSTTYTSNAAGTTARPWVLLATDRAFWFKCWNTITAAPTAAQTAISGIFFGDFPKWDSNDMFACGLCAALYGAVPNSGQASTAVGGADGLKVPRKISGAVGSSHVPTLCFGGGPANYGQHGAAGAPYTPGGPIFYNRPFINDGSAYTLRGWLPGLYAPCHNMAFGQLQTVVVDGKNFLSFVASQASSQVGNYFISLDDWGV